MNMDHNSSFNDPQIVSGPDRMLNQIGSINHSLIEANEQDQPEND